MVGVIVQHWNDQLGGWEVCGDLLRCGFVYDPQDPGYPGYLANPAACLSDPCTWCGTGRRHHRAECPVVTQGVAGPSVRRP